MLSLGFSVVILPRGADEGVAVVVAPNVTFGFSEDAGAAPNVDLGCSLVAGAAPNVNFGCSLVVVVVAGAPKVNFGWSVVVEVVGAPKDNGDGFAGVLLNKFVVVLEG